MRCGEDFGSDCEEFALGKERNSGKARRSQGEERTWLTIARSSRGKVRNSGKARRSQGEERT
jgi:hypothetical protein